MSLHIEFSKTPDWQAPQFNSYSEDFFGVFQEICLGGAGVHFRRRIQERETATTSKVAGRVRPLRTNRTKAVSKIVRLVHLTLKITTEAGSLDSLNKKRVNRDSPMNAKKRSGTAPSPLDLHTIWLKGLLKRGQKSPETPELLTGSHMGKSEGNAGALKVQKGQTRHK